MRTYKKLSFSEKIQWCICVLWILLVGMLVYMVVVGELDLGDSRVISKFANTAGTLMFFGGMGWHYQYKQYQRVPRNKGIRQSMSCKAKLKGLPPALHRQQALSVA